MMDANERDSLVFEGNGFCPICEQEVRFVARDNWFRDSLICTSCASVPRERALVWVLNEYYPGWKDVVLHETSPLGRGASLRLKTVCEKYIASQLFRDVGLGVEVNGVQSEDLERLTFADNSIDIHVSQDVMEHVFCPRKAFREIARTLRPGGAHVFTVPLVNKNRPSEPRARLTESGAISHFLPPVYHGNPVDPNGSLVTTDWGYDICGHIFQACGLFTHLVRIDNIGMGIRAEYVDVLVTIKPSGGLDVTV